MQNMEVYRSSVDKSLFVVNSENDSIMHCLPPNGKLNICDFDDDYKSLLSTSKFIGQIVGVFGRINVGDVSALICITRWTNVGQHFYKKSGAINRISRVCALRIDGSMDMSSDHHLTQSTSRSDSRSASPSHTPPSTPHLKHHKSAQFLKSALDSVKEQFVKTITNADDWLDAEMLDEESAPFWSKVENIVRLINHNGGFYACDNGDLTNSLKRLCTNAPPDTQYIWNAHLWNASTIKGEKERFYIPIVRGYVEQRSIDIIVDHQLTVPVIVTLIARRSVHRAGARYLKRGIDENAKCANFVETEQIVTIAGHCLSIVQIRGSVPIYWTQRGLRYRPPPVIDRPKSDSLPVFEKHLNEMLATYEPKLVMVNLVDQTGRELALAHAFLDHVLDADNPEVSYISFDFHAMCRGMRMERVGILTTALQQSIVDIGYTWTDQSGVIVCSQTGIIRTNCVDCLDRTNVIQTSIANLVLEQQLYKLGVLAPSSKNPDGIALLPQNVVSALAHMWADCGDAISVQVSRPIYHVPYPPLQYAGTAALKGDVTRSGQRQWTGLLKDGVNSASRYYICHTRDAQRQLAIDLLLGVISSDDRHVNEQQKKLRDTEMAVEGNENVHEELLELVRESQRFFIPADETLLGAWALIDCDGNSDDNGQTMDMNVVVMLTRTSYFVADCERVPLSNVTRILFGGTGGTNKLLPILGGNSSKPMYMKLQVQYTSLADPTAPCGTYFHQWRPAGTRLFNNMAIPIRTAEEGNEFLKAIGEQFCVAYEVANLGQLKVEDVQKFDKTKSKTPQKGPQNVKSKLHNVFSSMTGGGLKVSRSMQKVRSESETKNTEATYENPSITIDDDVDDGLLFKAHMSTCVDNLANIPADAQTETPQNTPQIHLVDTPIKPSYSDNEMKHHNAEHKPAVSRNLFGINTASFSKLTGSFRKKERLEGEKAENLPEALDRERQTFAKYSARIEKCRSNIVLL